MEGGYQSFQNDVGNYACGKLVGTNMGVSAVAYQDWVNRCPTKSEMQNMTQETAKNFYAWYFDRYNVYPVQNQTLAELLMNNTMGAPARAIEAEQKALNGMGYSLAIDGVRGPLTISALNAAARKNLPATYNAIRAAWVEYLGGISSEYRTAWIARMDRFFPPIGAAQAGFGGLGIIFLILIGLGLKSK